MLEELRISDFAVVEDAVITFGPGLNVLTGSTGAGKSIILTAVELLSGGRAKRSYIRSGSDGLAIEGIFRLPADSPLRASFGLGEG
ncbi:MAG: AAA family ATPase, partial [Candidatus Krumholzibacteria bacterium]|nr:AAA family ATPase [Candidatus Krumholzibacteria bacterium]